MSFSLLRQFFVICLCGLIFLTVAQAQESTPAPDAPAVRARLVSGVTGTGNLAVLPAGLQITLADGWHTYWRTPGDSGVAPTFDWGDSRNVASVDIGWPVPTRLQEEGLYVYAYKQNTLLPLTITPQEAGKEVVLSLKLQALACLKICVPHQLSAQLTIPAGQADPTDHQSAIDLAREALPHQDELPTLKLNAAILGMENLALTAYSESGFSGAEAYIETTGLSLAMPPDIIPSDKNPREAIIRVSVPKGTDLTNELLGQTIRVTLAVGGQAVEKEFGF